MEYPTAYGDDIQDDMTRDILERGKLIEMNPEVFLAITPAPEWWSGYSDGYLRVYERIRNGKVVDPPYLHIVYNKINHEGRHRALAAVNLNIKKIPVAVLKEAPTEEELFN